MLHSHGPLRMYAPDNTFCFTVLRDPVQRLLSQIADWRQLGDADAIESSAEVRECIADSRRLALRDFLEKHGHPGGRRGLDNYMTRALAAGRIGHSFDDATDPDLLREVALQSLEKDYDVIGLTEQMDLSRNVLCAMVGLPPARTIPTLNVTGLAGRTEPGVYGACDILTSLTRVDCVIYDRARQLFDRATGSWPSPTTPRRSRPIMPAACLGKPEASLAMARRAIRCDRRSSVRDTMGVMGAGCLPVRSGAARKPARHSTFRHRQICRCRSWSGSAVTSRAASATRSVFVSMAGRSPIVSHGPTTMPMSSRSIHIRLGISFAWRSISTRRSSRVEPGSELHDARKRGFAFDSYGWRPA